MPKIPGYSSVPVFWRIQAAVLNLAVDGFSFFGGFVFCGSRYWEICRYFFGGLKYGGFVPAVPGTSNFFFYDTF